MYKVVYIFFKKLVTVGGDPKKNAVLAVMSSKQVQAKSMYLLKSKGVKLWSKNHLHLGEGNIILNGLIRAKIELSDLIYVHVFLHPKSTGCQEQVLSEQPSQTLRCLL